MAEEIYGLMAEFETAEELLSAARRAREAGYIHTDAYSPFPIHDLAESLGKKPSRLPFLTLAAGLAGALGGYGMQYFANVVHSPMNVGGRPHHSWPAFIPITFETTILAAAVATVVGMIVLNKLPQPYHPVFNVPAFRERASVSGFFLCVEAADARFNESETAAFLRSLGAKEVCLVPA